MKIAKLVQLFKIDLQREGNNAFANHRIVTYCGISNGNSLEFWLIIYAGLLSEIT